MNQMQQKEIQKNAIRFFYNKRLIISVLIDFYTEETDHPFIPNLLNKALKIEHGLNAFVLDSKVHVFFTV